MWIISYWLLPAISACMWLGMLMAMLITWGESGEPHYPSMAANQTIAYISDIGAFGLKPLFITGAVITTIFLNLGFLAERWLRHTGRLAPNTSLTQKLLSVFSLIFAIAGCCGLILLSIFDTYHHPRLHDGFLLLFIAGYVISAIFLCAEYQRLGIHYRNHRILAISFWVKLTFIIVEIIFAIVFVSTTFSSHQNIAAIFEWMIAFVFTFYVLSFVVDLLPSVRTKHHVPQGHQDRMMAERGMTHGNHHNQTRHNRFSQQSTRNGSFEQNLTNDSAGPNQMGPKTIVDEEQGRSSRRFF